MEVLKSGQFLTFHAMGYQIAQGYDIVTYNPHALHFLEGVRSMYSTVTLCTADMLLDCIQVHSMVSNAAWID